MVSGETSVPKPKINPEEMIFTVFCHMSNILKNHAFWQTVMIWLTDNFTFLGPWLGAVYILGSFP